MKYSARLRSAAVLLAACMTVGLAACGGREESLPSSDGTPLSSDTGGPVSEDGLDNSGKETASTMTSQTTIAAPESSAPVGSETKSSLESAARLLGRTFYDEETEAVYFSHTGSGFELTFTGKQLQAELVADIGLSLIHICIAVPAVETYQVQELHLPIYHCLCAAVEAHFFEV